MKVAVITIAALLFAINANAQQPVKPKQKEPVQKGKPDTTQINNMPMDTIKSPRLDSARSTMPGRGKHNDGMPPKKD